MWGMSGIASYVKSQTRPEYNNEKQVCEEADFSGSGDSPSVEPAVKKQPKTKPVAWGGSISAPALDGESFVSSVIIGGIQGIINIMPYKCGFGSEALLDNNRADSTEYDVQKYDVQNFDAEDATPPDIDAFPVDASDTFDIPETLVPDTFDVPDTIVPIDVPLDDIDIFVPDVPLEDIDAFTPDIPVEVEEIGEEIDGTEEIDTEEVDTEDVEIVNVCDNPPSVFNLSSPADKAVKVPANQTFSWEPSTDPDSEDVVTYCLKVAKNPALETPIIDECGIEETNYTPSEGLLEPGGAYFWNVEADDSCSQKTLSSETRSFTVAPAPGPCDNPPSKSNIISPKDNETNVSPTAIISWQASIDTDPGDSVNSCVQVDDNSDFSSPIINECVSVTEYALPAEALAFGIKYYAQVTTKDMCQPEPNQTPGDITTFKTMGPCDNIPSVFGLSSPADMAANVSLTPTLSWESSADVDPGLGFTPVDAVAYTVVVADNIGFENPIINQSDIKDTNYTVKASLLPNNAYYWKVFASDSCETQNIIPSADIRSFTTAGPCDNAPSTSPEVILPQNKANWVSVMPTIVWKQSQDMDPSDNVTYDLLVAEDPDFNSPVIDVKGLIFPQYTPEQKLPYGTQLYVKVTANDLCLPISDKIESQATSFTTEKLCLPHTLGESDFTSGNAYDLELESNPGSLMLKRSWTAGWSANSGVLPSEATPAWTYNGSADSSTTILETDPITGEKSVHMKLKSVKEANTSHYVLQSPGLKKSTGWVVQIRGRRAINEASGGFDSMLGVKDDSYAESGYLKMFLRLNYKEVIGDAGTNLGGEKKAVPFTTNDASHTYRIEGKGDDVRFFGDEKLLFEMKKPPTISLNDYPDYIYFNDDAWGSLHESDNYWNHINYYTGGDKVPFNPALGKYYRMLDFGADQNNLGSGATLSATSTVPEGTSLIVETRTGSVEIPDASWSPWTALSGEAIASPAARYLQIRYDFNANEDKTESPKLDEYKIDYCTY